MRLEQHGPVVFAGDLDGQAVRLTLVTLRPGPLSGALSGLDHALFLTGTLQGSDIHGELRGMDIQLPLRATIEGDTLRLTIGSEENDGEAIGTVLRRSAATASAALPAASASADTVVVNGEPIAADERARLQQQYGLRMNAGVYWYDARSGAWGFDGGPTMGYLLPNMSLGGPLHAGASGGGTSVVVNGRTLHPYDLMALQMLVGNVYPGRYFLDASGNMGQEGGPPLANLLVLHQMFIAQQRQAQLYGPGWGGSGSSASGGGDGGWYSGITGAGGNESGGSGYVMGEGWSVSY
ncbi:MAG TPA: hypothetical protein P5528_10620 [Steroidobacteraceae bacterium]|nr:hypothetical protein [Steroidobacteraceae bacterium]HRX89887.1 hypothetical protein [Steroidobacteraceae bacterium]